LRNRALEALRDLLHVRERERFGHRGLRHDATIRVQCVGFRSELHDRFVALSSSAR